MTDTKKTKTKIKIDFFKIKKMNTVILRALKTYNLNIENIDNDDDSLKNMNETEDCWIYIYYFIKNNINLSTDKIFGNLNINQIESIYISVRYYETICDPSDHEEIHKVFLYVKDSLNNMTMTDISQK